MVTLQSVQGRTDLIDNF